jgi:hypothetical protein
MREWKRPANPRAAAAASWERGRLARLWQRPLAPEIAGETLALADQCWNSSA